jgi:hypothetical protein
MIDRRFLRFAAVVVVLGGYLALFHAGEQRLAARVAANAELAAQLDEAGRILAARPALETERSRLREQLRTVDLDSDRSLLVARFVHAAARIAVAHRTTVPAIAASGAANAAGTATPFDAIPLELAVEGRYVDVLTTIRALSNSRVLAAVDVVSLARKNADSDDATLVATLRVVLERLAPNAGNDARPRST